MWCKFLKQRCYGFSAGFSPVCGSGEGTKRELPAGNFGDTRRWDSPVRFTGRLFRQTWRLLGDSGCPESLFSPGMGLAGSRRACLDPVEA